MENESGGASKAPPSCFAQEKRHRTETWSRAKRCQSRARGAREKVKEKGFKKRYRKVLTKGEENGIIKITQKGIKKGGEKNDS